MVNIAENLGRNGKKKNGRQGEGGGPAPRVLTDAEIVQVEALAAYLSAEQIADYLGIGRTTLHYIMERQPDVLEHYKRGKAKAVGKVAQGLVQKAINGDTASAIFYLKTQAGWKETQVHEIGEGGKGIPRWSDHEDNEE